MQAIPASHHDLLEDATRAFAFIATVMPDGSPQVTPVWFDADDEHILINTAEGRVKDKNMRRRPRVALCLMDTSDPYRYLQIRGHVVERTYEGADGHIDRLSRKYHGRPWVPHPGQKRVLYKIRPEKTDVRHR